MARSSRNPLPGLLHHSDRGVRYSAGAHRLALEKFGAISSMSRKATQARRCCCKGQEGNCWDNAVAKSAFATLKCDLDLEPKLKQSSLSGPSPKVLLWGQEVD
jgi:putative transposase